MKKKNIKYVNDVLNKAFTHYFNKLKYALPSEIETEKDLLKFYKMRSKAEFIRKMNLDENLTAKDMATGNFDIEWVEIIDEKTGKQLLND